MSVGWETKPSDSTGSTSSYPCDGEPFERLIIDCVGPLPKSKSGHQSLLTLMCATTRYPEAIPLRSLKAKVVVKELMKFCTTFGLPKGIQTDQGTNFMSKVFSQVLEVLAVKHNVSSAYHPQSQGALERFHQTLKTMLRAYCLVRSGTRVYHSCFLLFERLFRNHWVSVLQNWYLATLFVDR